MNGKMAEIHFSNGNAWYSDSNNSKNLAYYFFFRVRQKSNEKTGQKIVREWGISGIDDDDDAILGPSAYLQLYEMLIDNNDNWILNLNQREYKVFRVYCNDSARRTNGLCMYHGDWMQAVFVFPKYSEFESLPFNYTRWLIV